MKPAACKSHDLPVGSLVKVQGVSSGNITSMPEVTWTNAILPLKAQAKAKTHYVYMHAVLAQVSKTLWRPRF